MADIIARFKGDTSDLDNKVKKATQTLKGMVDQAHRGDGIFTGLEKAELEFVRSLGSLETGAKSAKGTVAELTQAFTDMSAIYNRLSEEEKRDEGGKALRASLDQLKERIKEGQTELKNISAEISNNGNILDQLSSKLGISTGQFIGWGTAIGAGKVALDTLKDAFFNNENQLDEWGRIVQSSESVYNAFLNSLNNGDISGFLANIDSIISAARNAYDSLDELGTYNAFNQRNKARNNAGYSEALEKYKKNPTAENKKALEEVNRKVVADLSTDAQMTEKAYQDALRNLAEQRGLSKKEQDRFVKMYSNGSYGDLNNAKAGYGRSGFLGMTETWNGQRVVNGRVEVSNGMGRTVGGTTFRDMSALEKERFKFAQALSGVNDTEIDAVQALGAQAEQLRQAVADQNRSFNRMSGNNATPRASGGTTSKVDYVPIAGSADELREKIKALNEEWWKVGTQEERDSIKAEIDSVNKALDTMQGKVEKIKAPEFAVGASGLSTDAFKAYTTMLQESMKKVDITTPLYQNLQQNLADTTTLQNILQEALKAGIDMATIDAEGLWSKIVNGEDIPDEVWQGLADEINAKLAELGIEPIKIDVKTGNIQTLKKEGDATAEAWKNATSAVGSIGSALQSLEDPGAKVAGIIAQAIANIASSFAVSLKGTVTPWDWMAAATAGTATMVSTIAAIKSATAEYHAQGGIVGQSGPFIPKGTDTIPAMLTPGEVVLSHSQTSNIAEKLQSGGQGYQGQPYVQSELVYLGINNHLKRSGGGELITSKNIHKYIR